jgi:hypothetical protein
VQVSGQLGDVLVHAQRKFLQAAGHAHRPRAVAQVAPDLAHHGRHGVAGERDVAAEVEAIDRLEEPEAGDLEEIVDRLAGVLVAARQGAREGQEALHEHVAVDRVAPLEVALKQRPVGAQAPRATPSLAHRGTHLPFLEGRRRFTATKVPGGRMDRGCVVSAQGLLALCGGSRGEQGEGPNRRIGCPRESQSLALSSTPRRECASVTFGLQADVPHAGPARRPTILLWRRALEGSSAVRSAQTVLVGPA